MIRIGGSSVARWLQSPAYALHSTAPTASMEFGTLVHSLYLEGGSAPVVVQRHPWSSTDGKEEMRTIFERCRPGEDTPPKLKKDDVLAACRDAGLILVTEDAHARAMACVEACQVAWGPATDYGRVEMGLSFPIEADGVIMAGRVDIAGPGQVVDLKTLQDASRAGREIAQRRYDLQAAHYDALLTWEALRQSGELGMGDYEPPCSIARFVEIAIAAPARRYLWLCVESDAPHQTISVELDPVSVSEARQQWADIMLTRVATYAAQRSTIPDLPPSGDLGFSVMTMPAWAKE